MNLVAHLTCFVAVAEELHFGRAAARLGMAQPPLSQRIRRLEAELGVRLFARSSRHVALTPAGRALVDEAYDILARVQRIYALGSEAGGGLRAGIPGDLDGSVVAALIAAFRARRPDLLLDLVPLATPEQARRIVAGALDVGIVRHPCEAPGLAFGPMLAQPLGVLLPADARDEEGRSGAAADGPSGGGPELHLPDLNGRAAVVFPRDEAPGAYDELMAACRLHGFAPGVVHEAPSPQFALGLVLAGTALALVPRGAEAPGTVWRTVAGASLALRTSCVWRHGDESPPGVEDFAAVAAEVLCREAGMSRLDAAAPRRVVVRPASGFFA
ncbi:LysR family transcriptional regulator [Yinghuangia soli]|uniref:LysR substrate-binding domain-containing protein n=1 Tax=Yinghuangia soli TaxID=2908204 RepID=A0AA41PYR3_9ACTN|nr:LysR substrate-binding domain-containing protein [Yinghuangia soli]MCF2528037.1 LysR substrate-binding domain-containing protein [Yinghuangia soli]